VLTDSGFPNFFSQPFNPGDTLTFVLALSTNVDDGSIPDGFIFSILDKTGTPIPSSGGAPQEVLVTIHLDSPDDPRVKTYGSDPGRSPAGGGGPISGITLPLKVQVPVISGLPSSGCTLWPPDHKLVQVAIVSASDPLSGLATFNVSGTSNEPENGLGDGDTSPDIVITGAGVAPRIVQLRAERSGTGKGRVYTLTATATDLAGNTATATATCAVPLSVARP
jgi:hypothetical protein